MCATRDPLLRQLDSLLAEKPDHAAERAKNDFVLAAGDFHSSVVLFGCGGLGRKTAAGLRRVGIEPLAFADNNAGRWGSTVDGIRVYSPAEAAERFAQRAVFVVTIWHAGGAHRFEHTRAQLRALGCVRVTHFMHIAWRHPQVLLPFYAIDLPEKILPMASEIRAVAELWSDEFSLREFIAQLRWRLLADFDGLRSPVEDEQYFPADLYTPLAREVFVDCGAFDGDTLASFVRRRGAEFERYIAVEPDPANFEKLELVVDSLDQSIRPKVEIHRLAVASKRGSLRFDASGLASASASDSGTLEISCERLDDLLTTIQPSFIKMDIEGAEPEALRGAESLICRNRPVLAVCVYHAQAHLWEIPSYIRSLLEDYRFFLRPHNEEGWDLILYAVPSERIVARQAR